MGHYPLNKGINKPIELKGLVGARYIFLLVAGLGGVFVGFIALRVAGANTYLSVALAFGVGAGWVTRVFALSAKHGEHGAMKLRAKGRQPQRIVSRNARLFQDLKQS
ncbi:MAG: DUF4133 domain-containing protein [Janthinobacterium lividum]